MKGCGPGSVVGYTDWLRPGRSGDRILVGARFSAPVQTGPEAHPASCAMRTGSFPGVKSGRGVTLTPHPLLVPWPWKSRVIPLLPLWVVRPVQSLSACTRVHFTFTWKAQYRRLFLIKSTLNLVVFPIKHVNPLNPELNPICYLLALLGAHHFLHVSKIRVKLLTFRLLMSYIYGTSILDVSRSHTTTQHSR